MRSNCNLSEKPLCVRLRTIQSTFMAERPMWTHYFDCPITRAAFKLRQIELGTRAWFSLLR